MDLLSNGRASLQWPLSARLAPRSAADATGGDPALPETCALLLERRNARGKHSAARLGVLRMVPILNQTIRMRTQKRQAPQRLPCPGKVRSEVELQSKLKLPRPLRVCNPTALLDARK